MKETTAQTERSAEARPKVLILGTGAMAKLFGGRLVRHGLAEVTLAGRWREAVASMADEGIWVEEARRSLDDSNEVADVTDSNEVAEVIDSNDVIDVTDSNDATDVTDSNDEDRAADADTIAFLADVDTRLLGETHETLIPEDLPAAGFDLVLVLVKSHQTETVAPVAAHAVASNGRILTLQNGVGNREALAAAATHPSQVMAGVTTAGATGLGPNRVRAGGPGLTVLGSGAGRDRPLSDDALMGANQREDSDRLSTPSMAAMFQAAGFETELSADIDALLWSKLVVNCAINPLTALNNVRNGSLLADEDLRRQMGEAAREVVAVATARGVRLGTGFDPVAAAETVARKTQGNRSSMLQDMDRGAKTEIDAICGAVVNEGVRLGVDTPANARLWAAVKAREEGIGIEAERPRAPRRERNAAPMEVNA